VSGNFSGSSLPFFFASAAYGAKISLKYDSTSDYFKQLSPNAPQDWINFSQRILS
jgi:hypothetical protein